MITCKFSGECRRGNQQSKTETTARMVLMGKPMAAWHLFLPRLPLLEKTARQQQQGPPNSTTAMVEATMDDQKRKMRREEGKKRKMMQLVRRLV